MINIADLLAARAQIERVAADVPGSSNEVQSTTELASKDTQSPTRQRPSIALNNGKYYVVESGK